MADEENNEQEATEPEAAAEETQAEGGGPPPPRPLPPTPPRPMPTSPPSSSRPRSVAAVPAPSTSGEARPERSDTERADERREQRKAKAKSRSRYRAAQKAKKGEAKTGTPEAEPVEGTKKLRQGIVTSSKADKTITVAVQSARRHPSYEKIVRRSKSLHAHDENNEAGEGDTVRVIETRPMSRSKRWRLVEVVEKAK